MTEALFESFDGTRSRWRATLARPRSVLAAHTIEEVKPLIAEAEDEARQGRWVAVMLAYEAAPAFDRSMIVHDAQGFPLAWAAVFDQSEEIVDNATADYEASPWEPALSKSEYEKAIGEIRRLIEKGDTYQINYTFPLRCRFTGDARSWHRKLGASQGARYSAYLDMGRYKILSLSPELFFERRGDRLIARPMKGTIRRGRWAEEDDRQIASLAASEKNRAENLMIVDLVRNDLGKISVAGSVQTRRLFEIEKYPTLLQMTSTIESVCRPQAGLNQILGALFPCGSITGAPKISSMRIIRELEKFPRLAYTGSIGLIHPGGDSLFNVAIRTIIIDDQKREAVFSVGGGVTYDSTAEGEYDECLLKARFLDQRRQRFQILETLLLEDGDFFLLERHIKRARSSAKYFDFTWNEEEIAAALDQARRNHPEGRWKIRLLVAEDGSVSTECYAIREESDRVLRVKFAREPINVDDPFIYNKTTLRDAYENALRGRGDCDDVILWNEKGEATESCFANIVIESRGERWTPPQECGLLAGTFRDELIASGRVRERAISKEEIRRAGSFFLINSVQKWKRAVLVDD
ncbi:MAG: aminodeoxychorismate synthase component I [Acidobacteriota bacterium]